MKTKTKLTVLRTVYPPISSSFASALKNDKEVERQLRLSDFYMIGARPEARLRNFEMTESGETLKFDFMIRERPAVPVMIKPHELPGVASHAGEGFLLEIDSAGAGFRFWSDKPHAPGSEVLEWFSTESLLWNAVRGRSGIYGLENSRALSTFDLLYIGIAKKGDSFDRLIKKGHEKRMEILSSEYPLTPGARVSDEVTLFLFTADPLIMTTISDADDVDDELLTGTYDGKRIVADAEKAFVRLLEPQYNKVIFKKYPKGTDGLYGQGFARYVYVIGEEMAFVTPNGTICGGVDVSGLPTNAADAILVEGEDVRLLKAGMHFPAGDPAGIADATGA
ncbi:hypothetical protein [Parasedimentitalea psychrophila]|uniref:Uncharacterized protein n=1 Tax=Parasedimentitalea psychrophila TaxID=2997337 RepID=A0A9Y2KV77_9RHOB|nr:hypothetical protein [Parasedimentitalea psychrophila]WIY23771.1 hypothetical protein QPJ95_14085 [Parasedimentitalea psychrophila]